MARKRYGLRARGLETGPVSFIDAGHATMVRANVMGQAMMKLRGQLVNQSSVGPIEKRLIRPDMMAAMMKVMKTCEIRRNFLFIVNLSDRMTVERFGRHRLEKRGSATGSRRNHVTGSLAPYGAEGWNNHTS